jgi:hypothetical protein
MILFHKKILLRVSVGLFGGGKNREDGWFIPSLGSVNISLWKNKFVFLERPEI